MKISIVTPSLNQGRFLRRTLQSVADQTGAEIEHVVFDGGSTDNSVELLTSFGSSVRWKSEKDRGQSHAVNKGFGATDGEVLGWLNSDDIYYPGAFARVVELLTARPEVDVVYGKADHIDVDDRAFEPYPTEPWDPERLKETCFICQPALFLRRRVLDRFGLLDESLHYCMDYEYWLRLARAGVRFWYLEERLAGSRLYPENKTMGFRKKAHAEVNDMLRRHLSRVPDRWLFNYANVIAEQSLSAARHPRLFHMITGAAVLVAAVKWNRRVSPAMCRAVWPRLCGRPA